MALGRYIAICHPLHARGYIRPRGTRIAVLVIIVVSAVFNGPRFYHYRPGHTPCRRLLNINSTTDQWLLLAPPTGCDCFYYFKVALAKSSYNPLTPTVAICQTELSRHL